MQIRNAHDISKAPQERLIGIDIQCNPRYMFCVTTFRP